MRVTGSGKNLQAERDRDIEAMRACSKHARDLLDSARAVFDINHANIAFHLALLALEELGRRELIGLQRVAEKNGKDRPWQKHTLAHTKKIFWCFFGLEFFAGRIQKERFDALRELSETLHNQRMAGLYVDYQDENLSIPGDAIDPKYCAELLTLAEAQVKLAENEKLREHIEQEDLDLQAWFLSATSNKENTPLIFSKKSIDKLGELNDAKKWILWVKEQFDGAAAESRTQLQQELERSRSLPEKGTKSKWKIRIRITSQSHSVRQKPLNIFNKRVDWIKLTAVQGKPNELIVEFTFKDNIPIEGLWYLGWGIARYFVAALNIATMGLWWWHWPEDIDSYYESVEDVESKVRIEIKRNPSLRVDWGDNRVLSEEDMNRAVLCFVSFPPPSSAQSTSLMTTTQRD
jgi:AbiV family abortive infection protein